MSAVEAQPVGGMVPAMIADNIDPSERRPALNAMTLAAIGAIACIAADLVHEGIGHGIASWISDDRIVSISTVALQNTNPSRLVSAAGTVANAAIGSFSLMMLGRVQRFTAGSYFLWVFGGFNLLNVGYLVFSAVAGGGDWGAVISGLTPEWLWRLALALAGTASYVLALRWLASFMIRFVNQGEVSEQDRGRLVWPAYLAGGVVLTLAATLNPIGPSLILVSGVGASFGLNAGFLLLPSIGEVRELTQPSTLTLIPFNPRWIVGAIVISLLFIGVLGPGIRF